MARLIQRVARGEKVRFGGTGVPFNQGPFWLQDEFSASLSWDREEMDHSWDAYAKLLKNNAAVYSSYQTRMLVLTEARFAFQQMRNSRPGDLFGTRELNLLENPWPGGYTSDLIAWMDMDWTIAGNFYATLVDKDGNYGDAARGKKSTRLKRLDPACVQIIINSPSGDPNAIDSSVVGYEYTPHGFEKAYVLLPEEVAHFKVSPDPEAQYRGMSWLTPAVKEIEADNAARDHKLGFFNNGATLGHVVKFVEGTSRENFEYFVKKYKASHEGFHNAYKTLFLGGGADVTPVQANMQELDFSQTVAKGETRISMCSGVPPVIVSMSEGLQSATYSNYGQARRRFADGTLRPIWRMMAQSLQRLVMGPNPKDNARLWYDERDVNFLRDDRAEEADIMATEAQAYRTLVEAGAEPESATTYLTTRDPLDIKHTGLVSVQLLPPGTVAKPAGEEGGASKDPKKPSSDKPKPSSEKPKPKPQKMKLPAADAAKLIAEGKAVLLEEE